MTRRTLLQSALARPRLPFQRGVNFTAEAPAFYGSDAASAMLRQLPAYGVDAIALVPYGMARPGTPEVRFNPSRSWERDTGIQRLAAEAHELGIRVLLKPQVWVPRSFPGGLRFEEPLELAAWFSSYQAYIEHYARLAKTIAADLFCVGTEFVLLSRHATQWRRIIGRVRALYPGPLVYAANFGPEFEQLPFWDAVDYIGLNNYYPLPGDLSYREVVGRVEAVHRAARRPVIFTEAGFASLADAHRQPWDESPGALSMQHQARCYE
ncbi:MAG: hypothetical protein JNN08_06240, partial [Bryobacterales bacterium]|nr:hypothetical protein [Bryobacterales bacterium]